MSTALPTRRTQAERRAATRGALLDATIDCLIEYGYAGVTTSLIAERANVTRGAQAHHFATKAELVTEAVEHLGSRMIEEYAAGPRPDSTDTVAAAEHLCDTLWEGLRRPWFAALMELWMAARTDADLREQFARTERALSHAIRDAMPEVVPSYTGHVEAARLVNTTIATVRGLALMRFVAPEETVEKEWASARRHLVALWAAEYDA